MLLMENPAPVSTISLERHRDIEDRLRLLQVLRVEALGEPGIDGRQNSARFVAPALIDRKSCEVRCSAQFKRPSVLAACRHECLIEQWPRGGPRVRSAASERTSA